MSLMEQFVNPETMQSLSFGEKMAGSGITCLMGLGMTFTILLLLWILIAVMGKVVGGVEKKTTPAKAEPAPAPAATQTAAPEAPAEAVKDDSDIIAAVIASAIAAYGGDEPKSNLIVRKIKRVSGAATSWTTAGRNECIDQRRV